MDISFLVVRYTWDNGEMVRDMVEVDRNGQMVHYMRAIGKMVWQMVKVD